MSLCDELPSMLCCCSISISLPSLWLSASTSPCSRDVVLLAEHRAAGHTGAGGGAGSLGDILGPCRAAAFTWAEAGWMLVPTCSGVIYWLCITAKINSCQELMVFPEMDLAFTGCLVSKSTHKHTHMHNFHVWPCFPKIRPESVLLYMKD